MKLWFKKIFLIGGGKKKQKNDKNIKPKKPKMNQ